MIIYEREHFVTGDIRKRRVFAWLPRRITVEMPDAPRDPWHGGPRYKYVWIWWEWVVDTYQYGCQYGWGKIDTNPERVCGWDPKDANLIRNTNTEGRVFPDPPTDNRKHQETYEQENENP